MRLIRPGAATKTLIGESVGLITQTSTAGFEALVLGKPVWVLGEVFYDFHPGCCKISWGENLTGLLTEHGNTLEDGGYQGGDLVTAYYLATMPGALPLNGETEGSASFEALAAELAAEVVGKA